MTKSSKGLLKMWIAGKTGSATRVYCLVALGLAVAGWSAAWAQSPEEVVKWNASAVPSAVKPGDKIEVKLTGAIEDGWHTYSITQPPGGPNPTAIHLRGQQPFKLAGMISSSQPETIFDPNFDMNTEIHSGRVTYGLPILVEPNAANGVHQLTVDVTFQACNDQTCLPPTTLSVTTSVKVLAAAKKVAAVTAITAGATPPPAKITDSPAPSTTQPAQVQPTQITETPTVATQSLGSFLWLAMGMGGLSLLTPCVFPMIPITVSYFTKNAGTNRRTAVVTALVYGIGIVLTFTGLGMLLAVAFGAGGVNQLAANPWVNLLITAIFLGFAFSLFGAYFIQVPSGVMNRLDAITRSKEGSGAIGALLMGLTFTLTSFTCTAPFVGTLLVMTAQGNWHWPLVGMLAFSTVFAIPFFLLALAPQLVSHLPRAGGWMVSIKVVMGFLEIAAAMKFLSNADLVWHWGIFTRQVVLAVWVGIGLLTVLYVLGYFRMAHDSPVESVGAARITVAIVFLATTIWLIPGLFGRQLGELESFLPPEIGLSSPSASRSASNANLHSDAGWVLNDYDGALATAKQQDKLVFVDFTGYTCTNCRWMEANMFPRPEIAREIGKFVRLRLYTDGEGAIYQRQQKMQQQKFGTVALPLYAILRPDGTPVATFPGLTRNTSEFLAFLQQGKTQ